MKISSAIVLMTALLLAGCRSVSPPTPLEQLNAQQLQGYRVYQTACASCHYDRRTGDLHGPALIGMYKKPYLPSGAPANDERVAQAILHGRGMMPPIPLNDQEMQDLIAYMHTL
ncbi:MAG: cytochrome c [Acidobacteriaceae bacterium]|jgi:mono/diheme cytochrome c family protein|nr:cytochrome c [Acidobacteriaceae bacterium]